MPRVPISEAREHLADLGNQVSIRGDRIVVERRGKDLFALVSIEDVELLERLEDELDLRIIRQRLHEPSEPLETVKKKLGL